MIKRLPKLGFICAISAISYFLVVTKIFIPSLSNYHAFIFDSAYGNALSASGIGIIGAAIKQPVTAWHMMINWQNITYVWLLVWPLLPFVLLAPFAFLLSLTGIIPNLISSSASLKTAALHYDAFAIPFLFYAAILGILGYQPLTKLRYWILGSMFVLYLLTLTAYKTTTSAKLNPSLLRTPIIRPVDIDIANAVSMIPPEASVSTQDYATAQLAQRTRLFFFPVMADTADYLLLAKNDLVWPLPIEEHTMLMWHYVFDRNHEVVYQNNNYIVIKRKE